MLKVSSDSPAAKSVHITWNLLWVHFLRIESFIAAHFSSVRQPTSEGVNECNAKDA